MAPLAFLQRMDRPWHWLALSLIGIVVVELTYATILYDPSKPFLLPLVAGTIFALSLRCKPLVLLPISVWIFFRMALWFYQIDLEFPVMTAAIGTVRNIAAPFITARIIRWRLKGAIISRPVQVLEHFFIMFFMSALVTVPVLYLNRGAIGDINWIYRTILEANSATLSSLLIGVLISRCIVGRSIDLHLERPIAYSFLICTLLMPAAIWVLFPEAIALNRLVLLLIVPPLLYLAAGFSIAWVLGGLILHTLSVAFVANLGFSPFNLSDPLINASTLHTYSLFVVGSLWVVSLYSRGQKKSNQALQLMKDHLEDLVQERTNLLEESNRKLKRENEWRSKAEALLTRLTMADPVTELPNRAGIMAIYETRKQEMDRHYALLAISLENFRDIVESEGYAGGDLLIRQLADGLKIKFPDIDFLGRWDDSHLVALYRTSGTGESPSTPLPALMVELENYFRVPMLLGNTEIPVRVIMIAAPLALAYTSMDPLDRILLWMNRQFTLLRRSGEMNWSIMEKPPEIGSHSHFRLLARIKEAMENNEFVMHYQPIISSSCDRIIGAEALIRWQDSQSGQLLGPNSFIPMAEKDPVIIELGDWIIRKVAAQGALWKAQGLELDFYSINAAVPQLLQGSFSARTLRSWRDAGLLPAQLKVELTESLMAQKNYTLEENLADLRNAGVSIALDDFGTGYSSLSYLDTFPVDCIKVDRIFVNGSSKSAAHSSIIEAVGLMADQMGLQIIIEGVEDEVSLQRIRKMTDVFGWQGFLFSPPLNPDDFAGYSREYRSQITPSLSTG